MKTKYITKIMILAFIVSIFSCDVDDEAEVLQDRDTAGVIINLSQSSGALLGSPDGLPVSESEVTVTEATLNLEMNYVSGSMDGVSKIEVVKIFNGNGNDGSTEIPVVESTTLPISFQYDSLAGFLEGTGLTPSDLRIGDSFTFRVKIYQTDGDVYYYANSSNPLWVYKLTLNCASDLTGTYIMTNSYCGSGSTNGGIPPQQIVQNPDGTWFLLQADGGLLNYCTGNNFPNSGSYAIGCGGVVSAVGDGAQYCGSNGIGCFVSGTWDQGAGILTLNLNDTFFGGGSIGDYTATYVRQ